MDSLIGRCLWTLQPRVSLYFLLTEGTRPPHHSGSGLTLLLHPRSTQLFSPWLGLAPWGAFCRSSAQKRLGGAEGFVWLTGYAPSLKEVTEAAQGKDWELGAEPRPTGLGQPWPGSVGLSCIKQQLNYPTGQSDGGSSLTEALSSQLTPVCINWIKTNQHPWGRHFLPSLSPVLPSFLPLLVYLLCF